MFPSLAPLPLTGLAVLEAELPELDELAVTPAGKVGEALELVGPVAEAEEPEEPVGVVPADDDEVEDPYTLAALQYCVFSDWTLERVGSLGQLL